jgi:hypothetical protein
MQSYYNKRLTERVQELRIYQKHIPKEVENFPKEVLENIHNYKESLIVYIPAPVPKIILNKHSNSNSLLSNHIRFHHYVGLLPKISYDSLLYAVTTYSHLKYSYITLLSEQREDEHILHDVTKTTYGWLVYANQFEQLCCMSMGCTRDEAIQLRKNWNKKHRETRDKISQVKLTPEFTLGEFIKRYALDDDLFFYTPNYSGTYKLWHELNYLDENESV